MAAAFTALARRRLQPDGRLLTAPNLLTLSRAGAAAMLCGTAFSGRGVGPAWAALLTGCTVADWLDGPLARRAGTSSALGELLDLEADSWLTLWAAVVAARLGRLPAWAMLVPALRYATLLGRSPRTPGRPWQRTAGVTQMAALCAALSPWAGLRGAARRAAPLGAAAQLAAIAASTTTRDRSPLGEGT